MTWTNSLVVFFVLLAIQSYSGCAMGYDCELRIKLEPAEARDSAAAITIETGAQQAQKQGAKFGAGHINFPETVTALRETINDDDFHGIVATGTDERRVEALVNDKANGEFMLVVDTTESLCLTVEGFGDATLKYADTGKRLVSKKLPKGKHTVKVELTGDNEAGTNAENGGRKGETGKGGPEKGTGVDLDDPSSN